MVLLPPGTLSKAARHNEDAAKSAAGRALRVLRAAPTKGSSPAARIFRCVGAKGRFSAPGFRPRASWRLFCRRGNAGLKSGARVAATAAAMSREAASAAEPAPAC